MIVCKPGIFLESGKNDLLLLRTPVTPVMVSALGKVADQRYREAKPRLIFGALMTLCSPSWLSKPFAPVLLASAWSPAKVGRVGRLYRSRSLPDMKH